MPRRSMLVVGRESWVVVLRRAVKYGVCRDLARVAFVRLSRAPRIAPLFTMGDYHDLRVWTEAITLAADTYRLTRRLPAAEKYGLVSQLRRAAVSVSANIAEGCGRASDREFCRFLRIARGSAHEVASLLTVCVRLELVTEADVNEVRRAADEVSRLLTALTKRLTPA